MMLYDVQVGVQTVDFFPRINESELMQLVCIVTNRSDQCPINICRTLLYDSAGED